MSGATAGREQEFRATLRAHLPLTLQTLSAGRMELIRLHRGGEIDEATLQALEWELDLTALTTRSNLK